MEEARDEIVLVANIIDRLLDTNDVLRADELAPLTKRLRSAAATINVGDETAAPAGVVGGGGGAAKPAAAPLFSKALRSSDIAQGTNKTSLAKNVNRSQGSSAGASTLTRRKVLPKQRSGSPLCTEKEAPALRISSEVSQSLCCSLYNLLETAVSLLRASHGHIFVKADDDMASIANVGRKLVFPPHQVHYRCMGNADAEVLGSSIALNRYTDDVGKKYALLIFPIFGSDSTSNSSRVPIATIHVERREHVFEPFNTSDECVLYFAAKFCGELMSRVPHFDWLNSFYDPVTQHIVAPFAPYKPVLLPAIRKVPRSLTFEGDAATVDDPASPMMVAQLTEKMEAHSTEVLIRREALPSNNARPFAPGVTHMPSLLEIQAYVDNLQSCWKKNMTENVDLLESDRSTQQNLKIARGELIATRRQLAAANEKLRLYELESKDYKFEYGAMKSELNTYMDKLERLS